MACPSKAPILGSGAEVSRLLPPGHIQTTAGFCAHSFISTEPLPLDSFVLMAAEGMAVTASLHEDHMACKTCSFSGPWQGKSDSFRSRSTEKLLSHDSVRRQGLPPPPPPALADPLPSSYVTQLLKHFSCRWLPPLCPGPRDLLGQSSVQQGFR